MSSDTPGKPTRIDDPGGIELGDQPSLQIQTRWRGPPAIEPLEGVGRCLDHNEMPGNGLGPHPQIGGSLIII
jgi:hypothetical protein